MSKYFFFGIYFVSHFKKTKSFKEVMNNYKIIILTPLESNYSQKLINLGCKHYHIPLDSKSLSPIKDFRTATPIKRQTAKGAYIHSINP